MFVLDDLKFAARNLRKNRGFTTAALLTLALGIGATTAIFSVVNGVLLRPLPYPEAQEIVQVRQVAEDGHSQRNVSFPNFMDLREQTRSFAAMGAWADVTVPVAGPAEFVGDVREQSLEAEPEPTFYGVSRQRPASTFHYQVVMRGTSAPAAMIASARDIVKNLDPQVALEVRTLEKVFAAALSGRRFTLVLLGVFGVASLLLAMTGIYALTSYLASQRMQEVGVRMALGARAGDVLRLFVGQSAMLAGAGVLAGIVAAAGLMRLLDSLLYDTSTVDPAVFAAVSLLLVAVAAVASYLPARRASRADPLAMLRSE